MGYQLVENFAGGVDRRKSAVTAKPGTLRELTNAFVNAGGEIEKRKTLTAVANLTAGTHGLAFADNKVIVFGTAASISVPPYFEYRQLVQTVPGPTISRVLDVAPFADGLYVIARFSSGAVKHFYGTGTTLAEVAQTGTNARTHKSKMHLVDGRNLKFSAVGDPDDFAGAGSGTIDTRSADQSSTDLVGIEPYYGYLALLGRTNVQIWTMDPDPALNTLVQTLANIGLVGPQAAAGYGSGDVLFLSHTGIRSLRARDSSNAAVLNDIGSPIDDLIAAKRADLTNEVAEQITALVDPLTGHWWLIWGDDIFVLALYPGASVQAWSVFNPPLDVEYAALANSRVVVRDGDQVFVYGSVPPSGSPWDPNAATGASASLYDATEAVVVTPMMDVGKPATVKQWTGFDLACEGSWLVEVADDLANPDSFETIGTITNSSYSLASIPLQSSSTHLSVRLTSQGSGPARVGAMALHFQGGDSS